MEWRKIGPEPHEVGGYWVSLNRFNFEFCREEILLTQKDFIAVAGSDGSWISKIVHISPDENEIDVIAGTFDPVGDPVGDSDSMKPMEYGVHRIHLAAKSITSRFPLPAVFI